MNPTLVYFSPCGETKLVNDYYQQNLKITSVFNINTYQSQKAFPFNNTIDLLILSFPVYAQDIPGILISFLEKLKGKYVIINVTYGRISSGRTLRHTAEILIKQGFTIIGGAVIPTNHCYLQDEKRKTNLIVLDELLHKIRNQDFSPIKIPKQRKDIFAGLFPVLRHQLSVKKPRINFDKCNQCNFCAQCCPTRAISPKLKIINKKCIRCFSCIVNCPKKAIASKISPILKRYLYKHYDENKKIIIYK